MSPVQRRRRKRSRPKIGDVIEIATPKGFAYAQFTHDHPMGGEVLRILPGLYASRPNDLASLGAAARTLRHLLCGAGGPQGR